MAGGFFYPITTGSLGEPRRPRSLMMPPEHHSRAMIIRPTQPAVRKVTAIPEQNKKETKTEQQADDKFDNDRDG